MIERITVIGAGATGHAAAAYFSLKGCEVRLLEPLKELGSRLSDIKENGGILLRGKERGFAALPLVTKDPAEAIRGTQLVLVCVVAQRHEAVALAIAPYLDDGMHIVISPGNLGSFVFHKVFQDMGCTADITVSELEGNLFPARLTGKAEAIVGMPFGSKSFSALPASDNDSVRTALAGLIDMVPCRHVLDCAINSNNFVTHLGASLLSVTAIERMGKDFNLFQHALTPATMRLAEAASAERREIITALGLEEHSDPMVHMRRLLDPAGNPQLDIFLTLGGPDRVDHRYLTEDALCCCTFAVSVAQRLGVETPLLQSMLVILGTLHETSYLATGRTLDNLGYACMGIEDVLVQIV